MYNRVDLDMIIARKKQRDLLHQAEHERLIRLARAGRRTRVKAGHRVWGRLKCWLDQLCLGGRTDHCSRVEDTAPYLLKALAWMMAKE